MNTTIYFEGGGSTDATHSAHRRGLRDYCQKLVRPGRRLKIVAGGGREQTFDKFKRALASGKASERAVLLVDSEGPVTAASIAKHLQAQDGWDLASLRIHEVFLMVQTMEAWFLADRGALATYYDGGFLPNALPGSSTNTEIIRKADIEPALSKATKSTKKGTYRKIEHGSDLMTMIDPAKVETASRHAAAFNQFLRSL